MKILHSTRVYMADSVVALTHVDFNEIVKSVEILQEARQNHSNVWLVGNGGSASTASHLANDLYKMCAIRAFSVPDMTSVTLAYGNDTGWRNMFSGAFGKLYTPGDVLIAISCSGNSDNVVACAEMVEKPIILMTGNNRKSKLARMNPSAVIYVEDDDITIQESVHSVVCHAIARILSVPV
jgi:D-sedoheptulose 7-phosphate isomerase